VGGETQAVGNRYREGGFLSDCPAPPTATKRSLQTLRRPSEGYDHSLVRDRDRGGSGAGKTTVSRLVTRDLGDSVTRIPLDNYYEDLSHLDFEERQSVNYHPSAFEWELLREHLEALLEGQSVQMPQYDFEIHNRKEERILVEPTDVIVLEGILAAVRGNKRHDGPPTVRRDRRRRPNFTPDPPRRDRPRPRLGGRRHRPVPLSTVKPMHEQFIEPSKKHATT